MCPEAQAVATLSRGHVRQVPDDPTPSYIPFKLLGTRAAEFFFLSYECSGSWAPLLPQGS